MDILIKNIGGLPEDGNLTLTITPKGEIILGGCIFTHNFGKEVKAIALPEHGRLIDLDAYLKASENMAEWEEYRVAEIEEYFENCPVIVEATE